MPAAIPETVKSKIISQWLLGLRRHYSTGQQH